MIVRATSDLHLTQKTAPLVFAALDELRADAEAHGGVTVLAGDLLDQPYTAHMPIWDRLRELLWGWPGEVYIIPGNHDMHDQEAGRHVLGGLAHQHRVKVISVPVSTKIGVMVPYIHPKRDFAAALKSGMSARPMDHRVDVLWMHQGVRGAYMNRMVRDTTGLLSGDLPMWTTISGHYHCPQNMGPLIYCGSPYQTSFAEEGQQKGWLRWDDITEETVPKRIGFEFETPLHYTLDWARERPLEAPDAVRPGVDRVRVRTAMTRTEAASRMDELRDLGIEGAQVLYSDLGQLATEIEQDTAPRQAAAMYIMATMATDVARPDPAAMLEFAQEEGLWE